MTTQSKVLLALSIDAVGVGRLPEVLAEAGCEVTVISGAGLAVTNSRFVSHHIWTGYTPHEVRRGLEEHLSGNPNKYARVILGDEPLLDTVLHPADTATVATNVPLPAEPEVLRRVISKISFSEDAERFGISAPGFRTLLNQDDLARVAWSGQPFVLKAAVSLSGSGVRIIRNAAELAYAKEVWNGPYILQDFVQGKLAATAILYDRGVPTCWFTYLMCRNWPNAQASSSALQPHWHPEIESGVVKLGEMTGFDGLCGVDWVIDEVSGRPYMLEMNARPIPGMRFAQFSGVSFPKAIADWISGRRNVQKPNESTSRLYRMFPQNLFRAIDDHDPVEFVRTFADAPWKDPKLLLAQGRRVASHYLPESLRARFRRRRS